MRAHRKPGHKSGRTDERAPGRSAPKVAPQEGGGATLKRRRIEPSSDRDEGDEGTRETSRAQSVAGDGTRGRSKSMGTPAPQGFLDPFEAERMASGRSKDTRGESFRRAGTAGPARSQREPSKSRGERWDFRESAPRGDEDRGAGAGGRARSQREPSESRGQWMDFGEPAPREDEDEDLYADEEESRIVRERAYARQSEEREFGRELSPTEDTFEEERRPRMSNQSARRSVTVDFEEHYVPRSRASTRSHSPVQTRDRRDSRDADHYNTPEPVRRDHGRSGVQAKDLLDRLAVLEEDARRAEPAQRKYEQTIKALERGIDAQNVRLEKAMRTIQELRGDFTILDKEVGQIQERLVDMSQEPTRPQVPAAGGVDVNAGGGGKGGGEIKGSRNNMLTAGIRRAWEGLMKIVPNGPLPEPIVTAVNEPLKFWDTIGVSGSVLRPRWDLEWPENNQGWVTQAIAKIQASGEAWNSKEIGELLANTPAEEIRSRMHTTWGTWKKKYTDQLKGKARDNAQAQRRNGRRTMKAKLRTKHRQKVPELAQSKWDWAFTAAYQSVDESASETEKAPVIDLHSGDEPDGTQGQGEGRAGELTIPPKKSRKRTRPTDPPYTSHAPTYRPPELDDLLDKLDQHVAQDAEYHRRVRGEPREMPLPSVRATKKGPPTRIPRTMVPQAWLDANPGQSNTNRLFADEEGVPGVGNAHTAGDNEGSEGGGEGAGQEEQGTGEGEGSERRFVEAPATLSGQIDPALHRV
ncbi:hypothetical protein FA95DRAFT_1681300 [Auriscalpium vulgare]|uniref:Uncharacterized protein n=1 Tax=Auriscalpium vulgare TaxID=40419 RepID=A0ACB8RKB2_9AGAM|nr:hypothetical protein FA95DRAFT_1681300 [Auriscalpium vulgare]